MTEKQKKLNARKRRAMKIAEHIEQAIDAERKRFEDIDLRGGNAFEYGKRTHKQITADLLMKKRLV